VLYTAGRRHRQGEAVHLITQLVILLMSQKISLAIGSVNLSGDEFASFLAEDFSAISPLFEKTNVALDRMVPQAAIIFVYMRWRPMAGSRLRHQSAFVSSRKRQAPGFCSPNAVHLRSRHSR
jgi:hypothetical protein